MIQPATRKEIRRLSAIAKRKRLTDCAASSRETIRTSLLESLGDRFNEFVHRVQREITVEDFAYIRATERRVAAELYPKKGRVNG